MYDENQIVKAKWSNKTRRHYETRGYVFTGYGEWFDVRAKDLPDQSKWEIIVTCDYCGKEFTTAKANYFVHKDKSSDACPKCRAHKQHSYTKRSRAKKQFDALRKFCDDMNYELVTMESDFTNANMDIEYICPNHGLTHGILENMLHGHGCVKCSYEQRGGGLRHSTEYIKEVIARYNSNELLNPEEYIGSNVHNLRVRCGSCGNEYTVSFSDYIGNDQTMCFHCSCKESRGERRIREFLELCNIRFEQEKIFDGCTDKRNLPFDFYLPDYNLIIEYDGGQHFRPVPAWGNKSLELTVKHDGIKNKFCLENGIELIRIPYNEFNHIEEILSGKLHIELKEIS